MTTDQIHVAAGHYARKRAEDSIAFRKARGIQPYDKYATPEHHLAYVEAYVAGCVDTMHWVNNRNTGVHEQKG